MGQGVSWMSGVIKGAANWTTGESLEIFFGQPSQEFQTRKAIGRRQHIGVLFYATFGPRTSVEATTKVQIFSDQMTAIIRGKIRCTRSERMKSI